MNRSLYIGASLLSADMGNFQRAIEIVAKEVDYIHCDVMDGHFVPNLTFGAPVIKAIKRASLGIPLDVHLMIEKPIRWIPNYLEAGLGKGDYLTFHVEAETDPGIGLAMIRKAGVEAGISIKPKTPVARIVPLVGQLDQILVMTVEPGFGGQPFMADMLPKMGEIRSVFGDEVIIGVDGGIGVTTAPDAYRAGANILVAGNAIYGKADPAVAARAIRECCKDVSFD